MRELTKVKLRDIASRVAVRNTTGNTNVLTISAARGLVNQENYFNRRVASADLSQYYLLRKGDFAYNKSYSEGCPAGVVRSLVHYETGVVSPLYICFRPDREVVDPSYLQHYFNSGALDDDILEVAKEGVRNHGLLNVKVEDFFNLSLNLPTLTEQQRIAEILDEVDTQVFRLQRQGVKLSSVFRGALLHSMEMAQADPETVWKSVKEVGEVKLGRQRSPEHSEGDYMRPYLRVANVFDGFIDYSDVLTMNFTPSEQEKYELLPGDILLNEGQSLELVGRSAIYDGPPGMYFQNTLVRFRAVEASAQYARVVFKYWLDAGAFAEIAKKTTSIAHLGADRFGGMLFPLATPDMQKRVVLAVEEIQAARDQVAEEVVKLQTLKKALMDDLLTGKVRVPAGSVA
jgi:type I restriction enzyme S subunit